LQAVCNTLTCKRKLRACLTSRPLLKSLNPLSSIFAQRQKSLRVLGRKGKIKVTLVDSGRTHIWKPLLHEVAAGTLDTHDDEIEYLAQVFDWTLFIWKQSRKFVAAFVSEHLSLANPAPWQPAHLRG
jgi:hypothetical protein